MKSDLTDLVLEIVHRTDWPDGEPKAYKVRTPGDHKEVWLPASSCEVEREGNTQYWRVTLSEKLAIEKGLI